MKKNYLFYLIAPLALGIVTGCGAKKDTTISINIGTKSETATEIKTYNDFVSKLSGEDNESFLLATYSKFYSTGCACWSGFHYEIIDRYVKDTNTPIYYFDVDKLEEKKEYGISKLFESSPEFYVIKNNKVLRKYSYEQKSNNIMKSYEKFKTAMSETVIRPDTYNLYYVDEAYIDANLSQKDQAVLLTVRNGCGDCKYALPKVVIPVSQLRQFKNEVWVFDIQEYKKDDLTYKVIKDKYDLSESSNQLFGYDTGVVPTIQYYEKGFIKDAAVFLNDTLSEDGENYKVTKSYYTEERIKGLPFLNKSSVETKTLLGLSVPKSDVTNGQWNKEAASKYHAPILRAFLATYCL